jgi:hypothetical protein
MQDSTPSQAEGDSTDERPQMPPESELGHQTPSQAEGEAEDDDQDDQDAQHEQSDS